jgi:hypothetical protein
MITWGRSSNQWLTVGRVVAQAVSRWLPTAMARVRSEASSFGGCGGLSDKGTGFCLSTSRDVPEDVLYQILRLVTDEMLSSFLYVSLDEPHCLLLSSFLYFSLDVCPVFCTFC